MFVCDGCAYDVQGCCDYDEPLGRYCVLGSAYKPRELDQISIFEILEKEGLTNGFNLRINK